MSPRVGWNRKGLETMYDMCVGPDLFLVLVLSLYTCETQLSCVLQHEAALVNKDDDLIVLQNVQFEFRQGLLFCYCLQRLPWVTATTDVRLNTGFRR